MTTRERVLAELERGALLMLLPPAFASSAAAGHLDLAELLARRAFDVRDGVATW